ncbi:hypothetical protein [Paenibacillus lactis]|uniref:hypothetical protein n=1 Tax=Paenibacillus lactis TaxID=228574 RepID=UPI003D7461B4
MEQWALDQKFKSKQLIWPEMERAVKQVIDQTYEEWQKYDTAIEKDINQLQLEIE